MPVEPSQPLSRICDLVNSVADELDLSLALQSTTGSLRRITDELNLALPALFEIPADESTRYIRCKGGELVGTRRKLAYPPCWSIDWVWNGRLVFGQRCPLNDLANQAHQKPYLQTTESCELFSDLCELDRLVLDVCLWMNNGAQRIDGQPLVSASTAQALRVIGNRMGAVGSKPITASADTNTETKPHCNGPAPPNLLVWNGLRYELPPRLWQLLSFMWNRDRVAINEIERAIWNIEEGEVVRSSTVKSTISRLNTALQKANCPIVFTTKSSYLQKNTAVAEKLQP